MDFALTTVGLDNGTLAIVIALEVLDDVAISVPAAVYSLVMFPLAALWGSIISQRILSRAAA